MAIIFSFSPFHGRGKKRKQREGVMKENGPYKQTVDKKGKIVGGHLNANAFDANYLLYMFSYSWHLHMIEFKTHMVLSTNIYIIALSRINKLIKDGKEIKESIMYIYI